MDSAALLKYLEGNASPTEDQIVRTWLAADPSHLTELSQLEEAWALAGRSAVSESDVRALWERIRKEVAGPPARPEPVRRSRPSIPPSMQRQGWGQRVSRTMGTVAAIVVIVLLVRDWTGRPRTVAEAPVAHTMRSWVTQPGQRDSLRLADGSRVVMSGSSTLRIPENFGESSRDVYLDGEAYFEVTHDSSNAFRVHTSRVTASDLGTRFVVSAYADETRAHVAVAEGVVAAALPDAADSVILQRNDVAHVVNGAVNARRNVSVQRYFGWIDGVVEFDQDQLADAARTIRRHFGVEVRITDSVLARRRFSASVRAATIYQDLRALALLLDAGYERRGRLVILSRRPGATS